MAISVIPATPGEAVAGRPLRPTHSQAQGISPSTSGRARPALGEYRISQRIVYAFDWLFRQKGVIGRFQRYLEEKRHYSFRLIGKDKNGTNVILNKPYIHRWTKNYQNSILAKFYLLDKWMLNNPSVVTHFTLTVYQSTISKFNDGSYSRKVKGHDLTYEESLDLLLVSRTKILDVFRHRYPGVNYVWVMEAHETGLPHCHLLVFHEFSESEQNTIKDLWSSKYQAGSRDRGVKVTSSVNS